MKRPTPQELNAINAVAPCQMETDDCYVIQVIAADNLISRSKTRWDKDGLNVLKRLAIGIPVLYDHEWEVDETIGFCFASKIETGNTPDLLDYGSKSLNNDIIASEGWVKLVLSLALTCEETKMEYKSGKLRAVSLGGFNWEYYECGDCGVSIDSTKCPHMIPSGYSFYSDGMTKESSYVIRKNPFDLAEISFVVVPNLPNAKVVPEMVGSY